MPRASATDLRMFVATQPCRALRRSPLKFPEKMGVGQRAAPRPLPRSHFFRSPSAWAEQFRNFRSRSENFGTVQPRLKGCGKNGSGAAGGEPPAAPHPFFPEISMENGAERGTAE